MPLQTISILLPKHQSEAVHSSLHLAQSHWIPPPLSFSLPLIHDRNRARAPPSGPPKFKSVPPRTSRTAPRRDRRRSSFARAGQLLRHDTSGFRLPPGNDSSRGEGPPRHVVRLAGVGGDPRRVRLCRGPEGTGALPPQALGPDQVDFDALIPGLSRGASGGTTPASPPQDARPRSKRRRRAYRLPSDEATIRRRRSLSAASALASAVSGDGGHRSAIPALPPLPPPSCSFPSPCSMSLLAGCFREVSHLPVDRPINHTNSYVYLEKLGCYVATGRIFLNFPRRSLDKKEVICTTLYLTNGQSKTLAIPSIFGGVSQYCSTWYELLCRNTTSVVF